MRHLNRRRFIIAASSTAISIATMARAQDDKMMRDDAMHDDKNADNMMKDDMTSDNMMQDDMMTDGIMTSDDNMMSDRIMEDDMMEDDSFWAELTEAEWKERLTKEQFRVLRKEGTERSGTSPLNDEKRDGIYACAGCELPLFTASMKYESGTGWPSFFDVLPNAVETKVDRKLFVSRTEYHCRRCGGHQGHVFEDGPRPTGLRYCNNGVALKFIPT